MHMNLRSARVIVAVTVLLMVVFAGAARAQAPGIDLGDIAGGGDGTGTADPGVAGINPDTGALDADFIDGPIGIGDGMALQPVGDATSMYIDSVFIINSTEMPINSAGVKFNFPPEDLLDPPQSWGQILNNRIGGETTRPIAIGGATFDTGVGIHSVAGITYDLDALRGTHGSNAVQQATAHAGMGNSRFDLHPVPPGFVTAYLILSNDTAVLGSISHRASTDSPDDVRGKRLTLPIPPEAKYLTLVSGAGNGQFNFNSGSFGGALILPAPPKVPALSGLGGLGLALLLLTAGVIALIQRRAVTG